MSKDWSHCRQKFFDALGFQEFLLLMGTSSGHNIQEVRDMLEEDWAQFLDRFQFDECSQVFEECEIRFDAKLCVNFFWFKTVAQDDQAKTENI